MPRKLLVKKIETAFDSAKKQPLLIQVMDSHFIIRYIAGGLLIAFGIVGMLTPIPAGFIFVIIGLSLIIGLERTRTAVIRFVHYTKLHVLYSKIYLWLQNRKK